MPPIVKTINRQLLIDMIVGSGVFQSLGIIPDKATVTNILGLGDTSELTIQILTRKEQGVKLKVYNA